MIIALSFFGSLSFKSESLLTLPFLYFPTSSYLPFHVGLISTKSITSFLFILMNYCWITVIIYYASQFYVLARWFFCCFCPGVIIQLQLVGRSTQMVGMIGTIRSLHVVICPSYPNNTMVLVFQEIKIHCVNASQTSACVLFADIHWTKQVINQFHCLWRKRRQKYLDTGSVIHWASLILTQFIIIPVSFLLL